MLNTTGGACIGLATLAAAAADDTLSEDALGEAAVLACLPEAAAGQCTADEAALAATYVAALPCDEDEATDATDDDCPSDPSDACMMCMWMTGEMTSETPVASELTAALAICDPADDDLSDKTSGTASLVVSLLASVSAVVAHL